MKILEHGIYYKIDKTLTCVCGCKFEYETSDIYQDTIFAFTSCLQQVQTYVLFPECNARIHLSKTYTSSFELNNKE